MTTALLGADRVAPARTGEAAHVPGVADRRYRAAKRTLDIAASAVGLVLTAPVSAVCAVAVAADSPGPILFRQERVGRGGRVFRILKFRTMTTAARGEQRVAVSAAGDRRVTRTGRVLRATKLDELPQLVNVLAGDMSLVGPRPEVPQYVARWEQNARAVILAVRPGITDPVSIELRDEAGLLAAQSSPETFYVESLLPAKAARYVEYVRSASFVGDLRILVDTVAAVARRG